MSNTSSNDLAVAAPRREHVAAGLRDLKHGPRGEGRGQHGRHEDPAVDAVAVVHDVAHPEGEVHRRRRLSRGHQADEVRLDLPVDVVALSGVGPVPRGRRGEPAPQVVPRREVRVVEGELRGREGLTQGAPTRVHPVLSEGLHEGHLHVEVVLGVGAVDELRGPGGQEVEGDRLSLEGHVEIRRLTIALVKVGEELPDVAGIELRRETPGDADHLSKPRPADPVAQLRLIDLEQLARGVRSRAGRGRPHLRRRPAPRSHRCPGGGPRTRHAAAPSGPPGPRAESW